MSVRHPLLLAVLVCICASCATKKVQYGKRDYTINSDTLAKSKLVHTFFLTGNGAADDSVSFSNERNLFRKRLAAASSKSTLLFLGDNLSPKDPARSDQREIDVEISLAGSFRGRTIFLPGDGDWERGGKDGLLREARYITERLGNGSFLPEKGCPIQEVSVNDNITLLLIDSQWYLQNWDDNPSLNDDCDLKTRDDFLENLEARLEENQHRLVIVAMHHPLMSNGVYGGQYSWQQQLFPFDAPIPLPVVGSAFNMVRSASGTNPGDLRNRTYTAFIRRITTLLQGQPNVVVVSGHERNLQYLERHGLQQVISGALSQTEAARAIWREDFSYGGAGYATLQVYEKGESVVTYYALRKGKEEVLYRHLVTPVRTEIEPKEFSRQFPKYTTAAIYTPEETTKSGFHSFLWGKHYRGLYSRPVETRTALLDTLYGGVRPIELTGGEQSRALKLEGRNGKQYSMRALRKPAARFLQKTAFRDVYIANDLEETYVADFMMDFYTSSHPYAALVVDDLAAAIGVAHSNPRLYFVPRQPALGEFNETFGDELYLIEERADDGFEKLASFGKPDALVSTEEVLENIRKDNRHRIDENAYIRARLFDMLLGDWDRQQAQWRWGAYNIKGKVVYKPIPRDRDQVFPKYGGALLPLVLSTPPLRHMKTFRDDIHNVKWLNAEAYTLDLALITQASANDWLTQADYIDKNLTDKTIQDAFRNLPPEMQDGSAREIQKRLKSRRDRLHRHALDYYRVLHRTVPIVGTEKRDRFVVKRQNDGATEVVVYDETEKGWEERFRHAYPRKETREIWLYGLGGEDVFEVNDGGRPGAKVRLVGGSEDDTYHIQNGRRVLVYDSPKPETSIETDGRARLSMTYDYDLNRYDYRRPKYSYLGKLPYLGYNPDDGVKIGARLALTVNGFHRNPFSQRHILRGNYYFATKGYEVIYNGEFPSRLRKWRFGLDARYTSPVFSFNFFGYGNETVDTRKSEGLDYNRVKSQFISVVPGLTYTADNGFFVYGQVQYESYAVQATEGRFISTGLIRPEVFSQQQFAGLAVGYGFRNYDSEALPTLGLAFLAEAGWKVNLEDTRRQVPHATLSLSITHKLVPDGRLVAASQAKARFLFSNDYEFYQMATIGGDYDVRAFRAQRFSGKQSFFQSTDLRYEIGKIRRSVLPLRYGVLGGFDYGRVWLPGEVSNTWHTSYGGGLWLTGIDIVTAKVSYFMSPEGGRVSFGLGFGF